MADRYVEVTTRSWGSRMLGSFAGVIIGILLFLISFFVLWNNEGRVDLSKVAARSVPIDATTIDATADGKLVAARGRLDTTEQLGDPGYLQPGHYVYLNRAVEMYAWVEHADSETTTNVGGSETTRTEYTYEREWTSYPRDSSRFKVREGHENPSMPLSNDSFRVRSATVGAYAINPREIGLPGTTDLRLTDEMIEPGAGELQGGYLYDGRGSLQRPRVGDIRIRYQVVPAGVEVTAFSKADGDRLVPYLNPGGGTLYTLFEGSRESAIQSMATMHKVTGWVLRLAGFFMMWIGLGLIAGPISTFLDVLPFLGNLSRTMIGLVTFGVALVLSLVTIIISAIMHSIVALLVILAIVVGFAVWRYKLAGATRARRAAA